METHIDFFWVLALATKCKPLSSNNPTFLFLFLFTTWLAMTFLYWVFPGGPAWGKYLFFNKQTTNLNKPIIPGPRGFPIIGSLNLMSNLPHQTLAKAAHLFKAQRLMAFSLGKTRVVITCNPDVAKEILNSSVFVDRPVKESAHQLMFNRAIGFAPYGLYWKTLRRIASTHFFCPKQINSTEPLRFHIASQMVSLIGSYGGEFRVREVLKKASLSNMMGSVFGLKVELGWSKNGGNEELRSLVQEAYELLGLVNWSDHFPWLSSLDPQNIRFRCSQLVRKVNRFVNRIIKEHRDVNANSERGRDFVDVLLSLQGPDKLSDHDMVAVLWEMIFRGTDTVAVLIEWILARLVIHQEIQFKVQEELDQVVGRSRPLMESDIRSMAYLQSIVKEGLRLHPPGPLLSWARLAVTDTTIDGYNVPAGTTAMVNMWAITRDPHVWADPLRFLPDRFLGQNGSVENEFSILGSDLRLAPFGSGRRSCPGKALGLTTVTFWVGTLLHEFEWRELDNDPVDLSEVLRLSCEMSKPLNVKVKPRRAS